VKPQKTEMQHWLKKAMTQIMTTSE